MILKFTVKTQVLAGPFHQHLGFAFPQSAFQRPFPNSRSILHRFAGWMFL